jgi:hypothetical protein
MRAPSRAPLPTSAEARADFVGMLQVTRALHIHRIHQRMRGVLDLTLERLVTIERFMAGRVAYGS